MIEHTLLNVNFILLVKYMTWGYTGTFKLHMTCRNNCTVILVLIIIVMFCNEMVQIWISFLLPSPDPVIFQFEVISCSESFSFLPSSSAPPAPSTPSPGSHRILYYKTQCLKVQTFLVSIRNLIHIFLLFRPFLILFNALYERYHSVRA